MTNILRLGLFLACFSLGYSAPPLLMRIISAVTKCRAEYNVDDSVFMEMVMRMSIPDTENVKCMMACFMREVGQFHDDQYDQEAFERFNRLKWRNKEQLKLARQVNTVCFEEVAKDEDNECDMAYNLLQCFLREAEKLGLPISFTGTSLI